MTNRVLRALLAGTALTFALEAPSLAQSGNSRFDRLDTNHDGVISREEFEAANPPRVMLPKVPETDTTAPQEGQLTPPTTSATGQPISTPEGTIPTGSRIARSDHSFWAPTTVVTSEEVKLQGTSRTEDLLNSLPQAFAAQGANINDGLTSGSFASGTATVNLRGLGESRTLVLVNGRRLQPADAKSPFSDLNFIPHQLIDRVDVTTGGASAIYGANAVAGVTNFILDTHFTGFKIDVQGSMFMHDNDAGDDILNAFAARADEIGSDPTQWDPPHGQKYDGRAIDIAAMFGTEFGDGSGHVMAYATYRDQRGVSTGDRDYSACSLSARTAASQPAATFPRDFNCAGSATSATGTIFTNVGTFQVVGNQFAAGQQAFNIGGFGYLQRPDERYTLGGFADYEISPALRPYVEAMFMDDRTVAQGAPSGDFFTTSTINCDNPLLSTQQFNAICVPNNTFVDANGVTQAIAYIGRRNVEGGARESDINHTAFRVAGGLRGEPVRGISYDAYYQFGRTRRDSTLSHEFSVARLRRALDVVANPAVGGVLGVPAGTPVCRSALPGTGPGGSALDSTCVPYNIFFTGGVTPEALDYLEISAFDRSTVEETIAHFDVTVRGADYGLRSPWAEHGIGLNLGAEYRKEKAKFEADEVYQSGDLAFAPTPIQPFDGHFDVTDLFAETVIPIVENNFIDLLQLSAGYRFSNYDIADNKFGANSYSIAGELVPIPDVRFRASYSRSIREPNVFELFSPQSIVAGGFVDPCAGAVPAATQPQCANTGVSLPQYGTIAANPANQYNALFGGSTELEEEKSNTFTAGVVLQPRFIPGLAVTVDYFDIDVKNIVNSMTFQAIMNQCLATGADFFCSRIHRAPITGSLWLSPNGFIDTTNANIGELSTSGIDFSGVYTRPLGPGTINVSFVGTWLDKLEFDSGINPGGAGQDGKIDCAGFYGNTCGGYLSGTPSPEWRHKLRIGYSMPSGIGISAQWRYFSSVDNDGLMGDCDVIPSPTCTAIVSPANEQIDSQSYFDLTLTAKLMDRFDFRLGARNIFDKMPPIVGNEVTPSPFGNGNTFPQVYDALGRYVFAGLTATFGGPSAPMPAPLPPPPPPPPAPPPPATQTCADGSVILATDACPVPPPPPPPPPEPERG